MKLEIEINRQDYSDFNIFHFYKTRLVRSIIICSVVIIILQSILNKDKVNIPATVFSSIVAIIVYFAMIYYSLTNTKKIPKDDGAILGKRELEFTNDTIICREKYSISNSNWTTIKSL